MSIPFFGERRASEHRYFRNTTRYLSAHAYDGFHTPLRIAAPLDGSDANNI